MCGLVTIVCTLEQPDCDQQHERRYVRRVRTYHESGISRSGLRSFSGEPREAHASDSTDMNSGMQSTHLNSM